MWEAFILFKDGNVKVVGDATAYGATYHKAYTAALQKLMRNVEAKRHWLEPRDGDSYDIKVRYCP